MPQMDSQLLNSHYNHLLVVCLCWTSVAVGDGHIDPLPQFQVMTTTSTVAVTWATSGDFRVKIVGNDRNETSCNVTEGETLRICAKTGLEPATRQEVTVVRDDDSRQELYRALTYTNPKPAGSLTWVESYRQIIEVKWDRPEQQNEVEYLLELVRESNNLTEYQNLIRDNRQVVQFRIYLPSTYGIPYGISFKLNIWSQHQTAISTPASIMVHSAPRPVSRIQEVAEGRTNTGCVIQLTPPDRGGVTAYKLFVTKLSTGSMFAPSQKSVNPPNITLPANTTKYRIPNLDPSSKYEVVALALFQGVPSDVTRRTDIHTNPSEIKALRLLFSTTDSATISWQQSSIFLSVRYEYRIIAFAAGEKDHLREERRTSSVTTTQIQHLKPGYQYNISIYIRLMGYPNPVSKPTSIIVQMKPDPVRYILFNNITADSVLVSWTPGYNSLTANVPTRYSIRVHGVNVLAIKQWSTPVISMQPRVNLTRMFPGETYYVEVTAVSGDQLSTPAMSSVTLNPKAPDYHEIPEESITDSEAEVRISFDPSTSVVTEFRIEYGLWNADRTDSVNVPVTTPTRVLRYLMSGRMYSVKTYSLTTNGAMSLTASQPTIFTTKPTLQSSITPRATSRSIILFYTYSSHLFDTYVFTLYPGEDTQYKKKHQKGETTFYNLAPGTEYTVMTQVISGTAYSDGLNTTVLTEPEVLLRCGARYNTSIDLMLEEPAGEVDEYLIECTSGCGRGMRVINTPGVTDTVTITGLNSRRSYEFRARTKKYGEPSLYSESDVFAVFCKTT